MGEDECGAGDVAGLLGLAVADAEILAAGGILAFLAAVRQGGKSLSRCGVTPVGVLLWCLLVFDRREREVRFDDRGEDRCHAQRPDQPHVPGPGLTHFFPQP
ncbi:hypothetical protein HUT06_05445 [Actinomadura sp. NAK00032]|uniref:hypothetical protein n=1 Tax=Actinomadura sp. NAK00032 TaxID=2742128 RepID=UPI00158FD1B7|nr:hypothetical protein [Actinomadura sp. NAK00032]QKW33543.1 hypothetical protein HUT06_05445 [Actinomadura sp. NAK00032]